MARKGSQSKSGPNHASPNRQNTTNGDILNTPERDAVHGEDPSSHLQGKSDGSGGNSGQKTRSNKKNNRSNGPSLGKSEDIASCKQQPVDVSTDTKNSEEHELPFNTTKLRRDSKKSSRRGFGKKTSVEQTSLRILTEQVREKTRQVASMAASFFRASMMYVMEESKVLVERNRPAITAFMAMTEKGRAYVLSKTELQHKGLRFFATSGDKLPSRSALVQHVVNFCNDWDNENAHVHGDCWFCGCLCWSWFCCPDCRCACGGDFVAVWKLLDNKHCNNCWRCFLFVEA